MPFSIGICVRTSNQRQNSAQANLFGFALPNVDELLQRHFVARLPALLTTLQSNTRVQLVHGGGNNSPLSARAPRTRRSSQQLLCFVNDSAEVASVAKNAREVFGHDFRLGGAVVAVIVAVCRLVRFVEEARHQRPAALHMNSKARTESKPSAGFDVLAVANHAVQIVLELLLPIHSRAAQCDNSLATRETAGAVTNLCRIMSEVR